MSAKEYCRMGSLDDVPFNLPLGSLDEPQSVMEPVIAPEINIPNYQQLQEDTQYEFSLEKWVLTEFHESSSKHGRVLPSCPPYWLLFSSPQEKRSAHLSSSDMLESQRPRSLSLGAVDLLRQQSPRAVHFRLDKSEHDTAGYSDDEEGSSAEDGACFCSQTGERSKRPLSRLRESKQSLSLRQRIQVQKGSKGSVKTLSSPPSLRTSRKKQSFSGCSGKKHSVAHGSPVTHFKVQPRPSSAGPQPSVYQHKHSLQVARPHTSHGSRSSMTDSSVELLYALSQEERKLVETITARGYTLRSAILALQRTGTRSAEQILNYLLACDRLCELGYEKTQVEDALEMFQYCETKAAEFLHLLAQFCEMGFQQSTIKEVLLLHENHRESALEELMMRIT